MKSVMPVFRCLNALERNVEKCNIYTNFNDCHVVFQLFCKHGITKTHNLTFQDCEPLQAVFVKHMCPNILKVQSRALTDIMIHFPTYQEEITLAVSPLKVSFKSYAEEVTEWTKAVRTEIHLSPDEFDYFQVGVDSEGFLTFAEATSAFISIHFGQCGKPIAFSVEDMVFEANFILATLTDSETSSQRSQLPTHSLIPTHSDTDKGATNEVAGKENCAETIMAKKKSGWSGRLNDGPRSAIGIRSPLMQKSRLNDIAASDGDDSMMEEVIPCSPAYQKGLSEVPRMKVKPRAAGHILTKTRILYGYTRFLQEEGFAEFCSLFFGAMSSSQQDDLNLTSYSLATASDSEEDCNNGQMSQTF